MSYVEAEQWAEYMRRHGSLHMGVRLELGFAMLAQMINHALGGKARLEQYMPWTGQREDEATLENVMSILTGAHR